MNFFSNVEIGPGIKALKVSKNEIGEAKRGKGEIWVRIFNRLGSKTRLIDLRICLFEWFNVR